MMPLGKADGKPPRNRRAHPDTTVRPPNARSDMDRSKTAYCPWCREFVSVERSFAAHVASSCPDAPESAKAAYMVDPYPPVSRRR